MDWKEYKIISVVGDKRKILESPDFYTTLIKTFIFEMEVSFFTLLRWSLYVDKFSLGF